MLEFKEPQIEDKAQADAILATQKYRLCEYSFGDLFIWRKVFGTQMAFAQDYLFVKFVKEETPHYLFPAGNGDLKAAMELIQEDAKAYGHAFLLAGVTPEMKEALEAVLPDKFDYEPVRDSYDYIYDAQSLITLAGRKLHSKRNHVARFERLGDWQYENISPENIEECKAMSEEWCELNNCSMDASLRAEACAVKQAFKNFFELGLKGGLIRLDGRVVAFTMGQKLCEDTFIVHIEKAFGDVEGAYSIINREFLAHNAAEFTYVNREDDAGDEGLRKAKLSYHPAILLEKNLACPKPGAVL